MNNFYTYFIAEERYLSIIGIFLIFAIAFLFSEKRSKINYRSIGTALLIQILVGLFILKTSIGSITLGYLAHGISRLYDCSQAGARFIFGSLADAAGPWGPIFLIKVAPAIIFFCALMALLNYLGIIQLLVKGITMLLCPILGTSGAETLCATANSVLGSIEASFLIKQYLANATRSEMFVILVSGMATISAALFAVYGSFGVPMIHILCSSFMAVPGSILIAKILIPETEKPATMKVSDIECKKTSSNVFDAIASGTSDGLAIAAGITAMLIAFLSLIAVINNILLATCGVSLDFIFGKLFASVARLLSISSVESEKAGILLGQKLAINEFVAYVNFSKFALTERTQAILTYALCGFANFSFIGMQIGGIGALAPSKRELLTKLGLFALLAGTLTNLLTAAIASLLI